MTAEEVKRLVSILEKIVDTKIQKYALRENHLSPIAFEEKNMKHYTHGMYVDHILFRKFLHEVDLAQDRLKFFETLDELPDATTEDTESLYFVSEDGSLWYIEDGEYKLVNSITDVPLDNKIYGRKNGDWSEIDTSDYINDSPADGFVYGRKDGNWEQIDTSAESIEHDDTLNKNINTDFLHITETEKTNFVTASDFVEDFISNATAITREGVLTLINNNGLIPSSSYRITNYTTTTVQANTTSAGKNFDIIVTALSTNKLSENAKCVRKAGDTYFANAKLEAWEIKYCIDNDTTRFAWANTTSGKGVIYYMKDEWGNECPYDFKNIQFKKSNVFLYTFGGAIDNSLTGGCNHNTIMDYIPSSALTLSSNTFGINCYYNLLGSRCYSNTFGNSCNYNTFGNFCFSNTFGNECVSNTFGYACYLNTLGNKFRSNIFEDNCHHNTFGENCYANTFRYNCTYNSFRNGCYSNTLGDDGYSNVLESGCYYNTFGYGFFDCLLGANCYSNTFGENCRNSILEDNCYCNTYGKNCYANILGANSYYNTFGDNCHFNQLGTNFSYNTFGNYCQTNGFYVGATDETKKDYIRYIVLEDGCRNNKFYSTLTTSASSYLQRIRIKGLENDTLINTKIALLTPNTQYEWVIASNSASVIKQYCPENLVP